MALEPTPMPSNEEELKSYESGWDQKDLGSQPKDEKKDKTSPMEQLAKMLSEGSDTDVDPEDSVQNQSGQYDQLAQQNNSEGSPEMAEQATEVVAENPELLAAL